MATNLRSSLVDMRELSDLLHRYHLTTPYRLALHAEGDGQAHLVESIHAICRPVAGQKLCSQRCVQQWEELIDQAAVSKRPQVGSCEHGFLGFAVPLTSDGANPACLLGGGVRERLSTPAAVPTARPGEPAAEASSALPTGTRDGARKAAEEIARLLPQLLDQQLHAHTLKHLTERLGAIREVVRELGRCPTAVETVALVTEALVVLFELPRLVTFLTQPGSKPTVHTTLRVDSARFAVSDERLQEVVEKSGRSPLPMSRDELADLLPGLREHSALLFPLQEGDLGIGLLAVLDAELHPRDQALVELLTGRLAARVASLRQEEALDREHRLSARIVTMIGTLAQAENRDKLLQGLLDMSAELANATSGSLMLYDEHDQKLKIAVAKGMSSPLARSMVMPLGEGIAGRVASSGSPLLVNDIERDVRIATPNRPRFRTKSFISIPLRHRERLLGVLNLADRQDGRSFTELNLNLVQNFACQAAVMLERTSLLERVSQLQELSVTDPLTGLYNRRFLEIRLEEERNRSQRQGKPFSVVLADLDNFKIYNDVCGHLAGDKALRKAATAMRRTAREMDVVVRYGGEEFCLILPGTSKKESLFVAERLRQIIEAESFPGETNLPLGRLTISLGVATYPEDGTTMHDLLDAADHALYRAKEQGRNRTVLHDVKYAKQSPAVINLTDRI
jgi:diguanylate cyclase (GGDEF)-like protein